MNFFVPLSDFINSTIVKDEFSFIFKKEKVSCVIKNIYSDYFLKNKFNSYVGKNIVVKDHKKLMSDYYIIFLNSFYIEKYFLANAILQSFTKIFNKEFLNVFITNILYDVIYKMSDEELKKIKDLNFYNIPELKGEEFKMIMIDSLINIENLDEKYGLKYKEFKRRKEYYINKYKSLNNDIIMAVHKLIK